MEAGKCGVKRDWRACVSCEQYSGRWSKGVEKIYYVSDAGVSDFLRGQTEAYNTQDSIAVMPIPSWCSRSDFSIWRRISSITSSCSSVPELKINSRFNNQRLHCGSTAPCSSRIGSPSFGSSSVSALKPTRFRAWLGIIGNSVFIAAGLRVSATTPHALLLKVMSNVDPEGSTIL